MSDFNTVHMQEQLGKIRQGDAAARNELIQPAMHRLEKLARKMLKSYPSVPR